MRHLLLFLFFAVVNVAIAQQNTILLIADDLGSDYLGCFSSQTDTAITPNIRALAARGVKFTKVWGSPICSPTRAGLFTGRYSFRTGVGQVITNAASPQLDTAEVSIAELLKVHSPFGYRTACVGKWHLHNNAPAKRGFPNDMGYDFYSGNFNGGITDYYSYPIIVNGQMANSTEYATTKTVNDAIAWLDTVPTNRPFFLWMGFNAPHTPFHTPPANLCDVAGLTGTTQHMQNFPELYFKAALQALDTEIGRLLVYLGSRNMLQNTNIVFIGDNGPTNQVAQIANPTRSKNTLYDYGVRVPMIVAGPIVQGTNRSSDALVNTTDLFATIAEMCGLTNWRNFIPSNRVVDSKSFIHKLQNTSGTDRDWIFTEQFTDPADARDGKTIRNADYHLIRFSDGREEFYHQTSDIEETNNLLLGNLTSNEIYHYHLLCDSLNSLIGSGSCQPLNTEELSANAWTVSPNPTTSMVTISGPSFREVWVFDQIGALVLTSTNTSLDLVEMPCGVYLLRVMGKDGNSEVFRVLR